MPWRSSEGTVVFAATTYTKRWRAAIGEELECDREPGNSCDRYAVAKVKRQQRTHTIYALTIDRYSIYALPHLLYSPRFLAALPPITFATSLFAAVIAS